jgi:hypothetical protein
MNSSTQHVSVGDVSISDVVCDNIKLHNHWTASLNFSDDVGLAGMLLQHIRQYWTKYPSIIGGHVPNGMTAEVRVTDADRVFSGKSQLFHLPSSENPDGLVEVRRGMYTISEMMKYKPILSAVVNVVFKDVIVEPSTLYLSGINIVSYKSIDVVMNSEMVVRRYELM